MNRMDQILRQLSEDSKEKAQQQLEDYLYTMVYSEDNLADYFRAFGLERYDDQTLELTDVLEYCEFAGVHPEWVEVLLWLKSFFINFTFNYETQEIQWDDTQLTESTERGIFELVTTFETERVIQTYPIYQDDFLFFETHESLLRTLLSDIQTELQSVLSQIEFALSTSYQEQLFELKDANPFL